VLPFGQEKGGVLTHAPEQAPEDALGGTLSAHPLRGARRAPSTCLKLPVSFWTAAEATRNDFCYVLLVTRDLFFPPIESGFYAVRCVRARQLRRVFLGMRAVAELDGRGLATVAGEWRREPLDLVLRRARVARDAEMFARLWILHALAWWALCHNNNLARFRARGNPRMPPYSQGSDLMRINSN
jgi:hypothetical protein